MAEADDRRFYFAQFEFPWALGPDDGRYVMRRPGGEELTHILVLTTLGAPERRLLHRRRPRPAEAQPDPEPVTTTRATVIEADAVSAAEAEEWLSDLTGDQPGQVVAEALRVLNVALRAHRAATADPSVHDVSRELALVARIGHGRGDQLADGRWTSAMEVPPDPRRRQRRVAALRPQERLAALLGGHDEVLACEELALRARADLDAGREREAALQLRVALEAAIAELRGVRHPAEMPERLRELVDQRSVVGPAANEALDGPLAQATRDGVDHALGRLEAALRARSAAGPRMVREA